MNDPLPAVPFGAWPSPITAATLTEGAAGVSEVRADGHDVWWNEQRPSEGGRYQLVRRSSGGQRHDLFPAWDPEGGAAWNARTAVMEYGGGAWAVRDRTVVFANWADQRLYRVDPGAEPTPITPEPVVARGLRWSEPTWLGDDWLVCVRESHEPEVVAQHGEAANELVALPLDGSAVADPTLVRVLATGSDFVQSPAVRGDHLAWLRWDHPRMPWDGTELVLARIDWDAAGTPVGTVDEVVAAGGPEESVVQPGFLADGDLVFSSDRNGWWNPYRIPVDALGEPGVAEASRPVIAGGVVEGEVGGGLWVGGLRWWAELSGRRLVASMASDGADSLVLVNADGSFEELATPFSEVSQVVAAGDGASVLLVAGSAVSEPAPYLATVSERLEGDLGDDDPGGSDPGDSAATVSLERLRPARDLGIDPSWFSRPAHVSFPSAGGRTAHALHYPPANPEVAGPEGELPPLVVMVHGGPTSAARNVLALGKQFWTSRGFAVVDVNYGGSTGYGRPYRRLLDGAWGIVDVQDAVAAAAHLAAEHLVDPEGLAIRGGSAGGYTTLAALCFHDVFKAGASHYGVADLAALATDTHKFESRYLDGLVGPWPEAEATYAERSPIHHTDGFSAPLIVLQGSEDEVVPPNQAEMIVAALAEKGVPHAYLLFEGEQHGFRQAANIVRALEAELWFYGKVFGFTPADPIEPVDGAVGLG
ncbi:prolyl oligopeptidase family serine peptidase [Aquihabitans sp. G128]|uniref:alpha/beta hydrolase family protein n=1 Tax=Aquihabitans sp. G128 TaxID=2849779 RepID=UPI001C212070|nr:prolyl oligopeptidase family serine peptidase [Aquihabitans sp. G128]QXC63085.1 prolyl oligopeptidase family serine peptidase [Aquihabitans sp. G128]